MFGINGGELIILIVLAVLILGPEKLPEYARKTGDWIRALRRMAEGAKSQFKEETGTDFDEIDWSKYDPRQYDPRRIIREALAEPMDDLRSATTGDVDGQALRQDLGQMDPRALVRGKAVGNGAARTHGSTAVGAAAAGGVAAGGAAAGGSEAPSVTAASSAAPSGAEISRDAAATDDADVVQQPVPVGPGAGPAPYDDEAT